jgi:hypothetical protein
MDDKTEIINQLSGIYAMWKELIAGLSEAQIRQPLLPSTWTVKDVVAHLWSWQQASVSRAEAALEDRAPHYPGWWEACGPDPNEDVDRTNDYLYNASHDKAWSMVYADWENQYQRYLELLKRIPENDLLEEGKYDWMGTYSLSASAIGSLDHHLEHYEALTAWLKEHED